MPIRSGSGGRERLMRCRQFLVAPTASSSSISIAIRHGSDGVLAFKELVAAWRAAAGRPDGEDAERADCTSTSGTAGRTAWQRPRELPGGFDVRGVGGYVIAPGAVLPDGRGWVRVADRRRSPRPLNWPGSKAFSGHRPPITVMMIIMMIVTSLPVRPLTSAAVLMPAGAAGDRGRARRYQGRRAK